jgi:1-aminocyclopropane-1-carboxylate deaminase/D-cysteine desulfhydrase-like pyridoxal-dependent ACC family enzyme
MAPVLNFHLQSRIHPLKKYILLAEGRRIFVKRDDELSSGITGSKLRKYASLIPYILVGSYDEVVVIGSSQSNNVIGLLQLFIENGIPCRLFLLKANEEKLQGNTLWLSLLNEGKDSTEWITREEWAQVNSRADEYAKLQSAKGIRIFIVREGAAVPESLPGAMTLATDILRNEAETAISFQHIFIDSGTGMSAIGLLAGLAQQGTGNKHIHITLIAGSEDEFSKRYSAITREEKELQYTGSISFHRPAIAPSFGSITTAVLAEVKSLAKQEGILAEPVYTAKHFATAKTIIETRNLQGNILIINSGGALGLSGFMDKLAK